MAGLEIIVSQPCVNQYLVSISGGMIMWLIHKVLED